MKWGILAEQPFHTQFLKHHIVHIFSRTYYTTESPSIIMNAIAKRTSTEIYWDIFLSIEDDMIGVTKFFDRCIDNNHVYSIQFEKIILVSCSTIEHILKDMMSYNQIKSKGIKNYIEMLRVHYPHIYRCKVYIPRFESMIEPFKDLERNDTSTIDWWKSYNKIKHDPTKGLSNATFDNATKSMAALYILIFYRSGIFGEGFDSYASKFIYSDYALRTAIFDEKEQLPDKDKFKGTVVRRTNMYSTILLTYGNK